MDGKTIRFHHSPNFGQGCFEVWNVFQDIRGKDHIEVLVWKWNVPPIVDANRKIGLNAGRCLNNVNAVDNRPLGSNQASLVTGTAADFKDSEPRAKVMLHPIEFVCAQFI